jgi:hypothetical protein
MDMTVPSGLVWRALKVGRSGDPNIDMLARRVATGTLRVHPAFRWMIVVIALLALPPMLHLLERHPPWLTVSAQASAVIVLSAIAVRDTWDCDAAGAICDELRAEMSGPQRRHRRGSREPTQVFASSSCGSWRPACRWSWEAWKAGGARQT